MACSRSGSAAASCDRLRPGDLFSFWLIWYGFVRAYLETFREGWNWAVQGIPVATAISIAAIVVGVATILWRHRPRDAGPEPALEPEPAPEPEPEARAIGGRARARGPNDGRSLRPEHIGGRAAAVAPDLHLTVPRRSSSGRSTGPRR